MTLEYDPTLAKQPWPQTGHVTPTASCGPRDVSATPSLCDLAPHSEGFLFARVLRNGRKSVSVGMPLRLAVST